MDRIQPLDRASRKDLAQIVYRALISETDEIDITIRGSEIFIFIQADVPVTKAPYIKWEIKLREGNQYNERMIDLRNQLPRKTTM